MHHSHSESSAPQLITRREAIQRAALLLGVAISPSILAGALRAQPAAAGVVGKPLNLTAKEFSIVTAAAERILPRTDTPGATDVGVPAFIDLMVGGYMTADEQKMFKAGLAETEAASMKAHRAGFTALAPAQQDAVLKAIATASQKKGKSFFHQLRELTILGYFTSEPVGKNVLHYDPVPGKFQSDVPLAEVGNRSWTK
ncbi:MAG: gluconate 2-dehydrogenase subunit 3 family protein [Opitutaceae bacterium]